MARFLESQFGKRDLTATNHWRNFDFADYKIIRPTLICIGGNGTTDTKNKDGSIRKGTQKINGVCAIAERLVGLQSGEVAKDRHSTYHLIDILGFSYGKEKEEDTTGSFSKEEVDKIVDNMLMPLCMNFETNEVYSIDQCCKNMSMITFFTHCWGAREVGIIMQKFYNELIGWGFEKDDVEKIFSYCCQITYSPFTDQILVPTFRVDSLTDSVHRGYGKMYEDYYKEKLEGIKVKYDPKGYLHGKKNQFVSQEVVTLWVDRLVNSPLNKDLKNIYDEHSIEVLNRDATWSSLVMKGDQEIRDARNADKVSQMIGYVMARNLSISLSRYNADYLEKRNNLHDIVREAETILDYDDIENEN